MPFLISSTVRQTPLWLRLWSIFNSPDKGEATQNVLLLPLFCTSFTIPVFSIIPVNMPQISEFVTRFSFFKYFCYLCALALLKAVFKSPKGGIYYMLIIDSKDCENIDKALKKYKKKFEKSKILLQLRDRQAFTKPSVTP